VTRHERQARLAPRIDLTERLARPDSLRWRVHVLGATVLAAYLVLAVLSIVQAPALWRHEVAPRTQVFFEMLSSVLQPVLSFAPSWLLENSLFATPWSIVLSYWIALVVATVAVLALALSLWNRPEPAGAGLPRLLLRWSYGFAAACALAFPVFTQDMWLSAAWGRMIAGGVNPFHTLFTPESLAGLPLDHFPMPMSYGPLWGLVSGAVMLVAGSSVLLTFLLFKAVLATAWIGALHLVCRLTEGLTHNHRCVAIVLFGWLPAGVSQSLAEGHNDIAMVALALLWLLQLTRGRALAPVALAASVLCKYVTAPLFLIDALYALRYAKVGSIRYLLRLVPPAALALAAMALFYRSPEFFDGVRLVSSWYFLQPRDAVQAIELALGLRLLPLELAVTALFPVYAAYAAWTAWNEPTRGRLLQAALATMCAVLFTAVSHLWAWYVIWALALAVLSPSWWLSRLIIGVSIISPFTLGFWWIEPFANHREAAAFGMYAFAALWVLLTRPGPLVSPLAAAAERA
jgi:alpha-1,6-mannosyltransferase